MEKNLKKEIISIFEIDIIPMLSEHNGSCIIKDVTILPKVIIINIYYVGQCTDCAASESTIKQMELYLKEELSERFHEFRRIHINNLTNEKETKHILKD